MQSTAELIDALGRVFKGDIVSDAESLQFYSHDASLFELRPKLVVFPKDTEDVCNLVAFVNENKKNSPELSLTARSGGTDMSGGAINDSIVVVFDKYLNHIGTVSGNSISSQPGAYYRDFEPITLAEGLLLPSYPASRELCAIGGIVSNNAGGEKSLVYGKTDKYVTQVKIILRDGKEHIFKAIKRPMLDQKLTEEGIEADIYRRVYELVTKNQSAIKDSKPHVSKNSSGYNLWDVWDGETLDITKLIVGSQGTLGLLSEATFKLVPAMPLSGMVVAFMPSINNLGQVINALLPLKPTSLESFDEHTIKFAFRFFLGFRKTLGWKRFVLLGLSFIPVLNKLLRYFPHLPKIVLLIEFEGDKQNEIDAKMKKALDRMETLGIETHLAKDKHQEEKFWTMRRESFNLLRKNVKHKHTAPFIDDLIVPPQTMSEFLPRLDAILNRYELMYTVAGHMGDGNFHIIPLMDLTQPTERVKIYPVLEEVTDLVLEYKGSLSGEHNDGLVRGPMLERMYGANVAKFMQSVKQIFDPENLFNPHKKTEATMEFSKKHIRERF